MNPRADRIATELHKRGVPVRDVDVLDALLDLVDHDPEAEARFLDWLIDDVDVRAGELAEAVVARARPRQWSPLRNLAT
jgi:hypothetical protein